MKELKQIADNIKNGKQQDAISVREMLSWFGAERRGVNVVFKIRQELKKHKIQTEPNFEDVWIDSKINFVKQQSPTESEVLSKDSEFEIIPGNKIGLLEAANTQPQTVTKETPLQKAITIMMAEGYSQLPVIAENEKLVGAISWRTIAVAEKLGDSKELVKQYMDMKLPNTARKEESLFKAITHIANEDFVIVVDDDYKPVGIVTGYDLSFQLQNLAEPFALIAEIEIGLRELVDPRFSTEELKKYLGEPFGRKVEKADDLTFGSYKHLLSSDEAWKKFTNTLDKDEFVKRIEKARVIRNNLMHFDPDGLKDTEVAFLRQFAEFVRELKHYTE